MEGFIYRIECFLSLKFLSSLFAKIPGYPYLVYTDLNKITGPTKFDANPITNKKATVI